MRIRLLHLSLTFVLASCASGTLESSESESDAEPDADAVVDVAADTPDDTEGDTERDTPTPPDTEGDTPPEDSPDTDAATDSDAEDAGDEHDSDDGDGHGHDADVDSNHTHDSDHDAGTLTDGDTDMIAYACEGPSRLPSECGAPIRGTLECESASHISEPETIAYEAALPSCGDHRPQWGRWGEYEFVPSQRWLHNMEHGGVAFLYDPCVPAAVVDSLRSFAQGRADDDGGAFRWILTPYPDLPTAVAVVSWGNTLEMDCFDVFAVQTFLRETYRTAPEDVARDGGYDRLWLGRGDE